MKFPLMVAMTEIMDKLFFVACLYNSLSKITFLQEEL